nr:DUF4160 domain-containing protein [Aquibium microcysteis]
MHIHVVKDGVDAKFWLSSHVSLAYNDGFSARVLREFMISFATVAQK